MGHFRNIRSPLEDYDDLSGDRAEALLDAMALVMVAEGELKEIEDREIERIRQALDERTGLNTEAYLEQTLANATEVAGNEEAIERWARSIAERLDEPLRDEAYYLASRIAAIDVEVVNEETEVLRTYVDVFDIPRERLSRLTQRLREYM